MFRRLITSCFIFFMSISVSAANGIPADELFKQPDIFSMSLSPEGKYVLEIGRTEDRRILNLIDTNTLKKYRISNEPIDKSAVVTDYTWLDETTLYVQKEKKAWSFFSKKTSNAYIVKINPSKSPLQVTWLEIPVDGYVLPKPIDAQGNLIFAQKEGDFGEYYRLYQTTLDDLLGDQLNNFKKYRTGLSEALFFSYDQNSDSLIGYTYNDDSVDVWYLPPDDFFWSRLYRHDLEDEFTPLAFINKNSLAVLTSKNSNFTYVAEFDIDQQKFTRVIYKHPSHDLVDATLSQDGSLHSISYIQHGVRNTEYISSDAKNVNDSLLQHITDRKTLVVDASTNGNFKLVLAHASNTPGELYLFNAHLNKVYSLGLLRKNLTDYVLAQAEVFNVELDDGMLIEGIVTKPSVASNGVLIVNPHGGPIGERDYANFNLEHQFYASRGYTILNVNFRGSTGFGKSFEDQGRGQFGKLIEEDIMAVYQYFIKDKRFDYTCAMGASYGGYSALMLAIKHPESFQCAVSAFGVFDLPHLFNATNFRTLPENQKGLKRVMGDDIAKLTSISPIKLADKLEVPVLIMAGENDPIAPFEQSNRMKYALEKLGKYVDFHAYENTGHGHSHWTGERHQHNAIHHFIEDTRSNLYRIEEAFNKKDIANIKVRMGHLSNINTQDRKGYSLLHYAIEHQDEVFASQMIELLLAKGIELELENNAGETALYLAVSKQKAELVKLLLAKGANVNTENNNEWTPLFLAASEGYVDIAETLLQYDIDLDDIHPKGWTALMFTTNAIKQVDGEKQAKIAKLLLAQDVNVEARTNKGLTVLMNAAFNGKLSIVKLLIEAGADVHSTNPKQSYKTALDYARNEKHTDIVDYLKPIVKNTQKPSLEALRNVIKKLKNDEISAALNLIPTLPNIDEIDDKGQTAMHYAVMLENEDDSVVIMKALLTRGADINHKSFRRISPLYLAVKLEKANVVKYLLQEGAMLNQKGPNRWTPLFRAISQGNLEIVEEMSNYWLDLEHKATKGWSAFMYITNNVHGGNDEDQAEIGKILIEQGANIEVRTTSGLTPLMNAADNGKFKVVQMLLNAGADIHAQNPKQKNKTPLDYAIKSGHKKIAEYIREQLRQE